MEKYVLETVSKEDIPAQFEYFDTVTAAAKAASEKSNQETSRLTTVVNGDNYRFPDKEEVNSYRSALNSFRVEKAIRNA